MKLNLLLFSLPNCHNCKYYVDHQDDDLAKCKKFKSVINNRTFYELAEVCRKDNKKCGYLGKEYIKNI